MKKYICIALCSLIGLFGGGCFVSCRAPITVGAYSYGSAECFKGDKIYPSADVTQINVHWIVGEVKVIASECDSITLTESGKNLAEDEKVHSFITDGTLNVYFWKSKHTALVDGQDKNLTISLPQNAKFALNIESVSGAVVVENCNAENFKATTVSGSIKTEKINAEHFECASTSGKVSCLNIQCESSKVSSVSGKLEIKGVSTSNLDASTVSGALNIQLEKCEKAKLETVSGNANFTLPKNGATVIFDSVSGDLKTDIAYTVISDKRIFGDGKCVVEFNSTSGNLTVA